MVLSRKTLERPPSDSPRLDHAQDAGVDRPSADVADVLPDHHLERGNRDRGQRRHLPAARRPAVVPAAHDHLGMYSPY